MFIVSNYTYPREFSKEFIKDSSNEKKRIQPNKKLNILTLFYSILSFNFFPSFYFLYFFLIIYIFHFLYRSTDQRHINIFSRCVIWFLKKQHFNGCFSDILFLTFELSLSWNISVKRCSYLFALETRERQHFRKCIFKKKWVVT